MGHQHSSQGGSQGLTMAGTLL